MITLPSSSLRRVVGGVSAEEAHEDSLIMKNWLADQGMSPGLQAFFLDEFSSESIRDQLAREASPTAGRINDVFIYQYTDASAAVVLRGDHAVGPIICIGQADQGEDEEVVFGHTGAYYGYQVV
ncbi:hypothetical protein ACFQU1_05475 [Chelatococcus sp. GCM10030263]|uniref:hypothetical protein n=1 Tax=Chelatococcus sp. GCM10030263 TaxID=3273387 RepID=UPI003614EA9A